MSTAHPEEAHISTSAHRRHTTISSYIDEAAKLEAGGVNGQASVMNRSRGSRGLTFFLLIMTWIYKKASNFKALRQESPHAADYARGYAKFKYDNLEDYPKGWPRMAAFLVSNNNFSNFRCFSYLQARLLLKLENELEHIEAELKNLDNIDNTAPTEGSAGRLRGSIQDTDQTSPQNELLNKYQSKIITYNDLFLKFSTMKSLGRTSKENHLSMFNWIWSSKPLRRGNYDWIFYPEDFIPLVKTQSNIFEGILRHDSMPKFAKEFLQSDREKSRTKHLSANYYSAEKLVLLRAVTTVFTTVLILLGPIILFLMTPMTKASMSIVVLASVLIFSVIMSSMEACEFKDVVIGAATYCAVLVAFLGNLVDSCGVSK